MSTRRALAVVPLALVLLTLTGCPRPPEETAPIVELEPLFITILKKGDKTLVKDFDQAELFERAERQFREGRVSPARKTWLMIARETNNREAAGLAWFNVALCELALDKPGAALEAVEQARTLVTDAETRTHIGLLELRALAGLGEWEQVRNRGTALLDQHPPAEWLAQTLLFVGRAEFQAGDLAEADRRFAEALDVILHTVSLKEQYGDGTLAEIYFRRGQIHRRLFDSLEFKLPVERMTLDMTDKLALMRQAEELFLGAVRMRNVTWSPRAGFETASLYHGFALDLLKAEVPGDLNELEMQVYAEELAKKILPLLQKARNIHQNNISMCTTYRFDSPWKKRSEEKLKELDALEKDLTRQ
jgi:tetratricopeptide (TPR) repeat protein